MNETDFENVVITNEEEAIIDLNNRADRARMMKSLQEDPRFIKLFSNGYIKDWAITQTNNMSTYQRERRVGVMEQMLARSVFAQYCETIIDDGNMAIDTLQAIKAEEEIQDAELSAE